MSVMTWARRAAGTRRGDDWPRRRCTRPRRPSRRKRALSRLNCRTVTRNARAPSWFVILPARAALTRPARGTSFLLIVKVSIRGGHFHGAVRGGHFHRAPAGVRRTLTL